MAITAASGGSQTSGGAGMAAQLGDFAVVLTSPTTLSIGGNCSVSTPCNARFGTQVYSITAAAGRISQRQRKRSGIYLHRSLPGALTVGDPLSATCGGSCIVVSGHNGVSHQYDSALYVVGGKWRLGPYRRHR